MKIDRSAAVATIETVIEAKDAPKRVAEDAPRLRWPIRDGWSTWLGTVATTGFAFAVMGVCAAVGASLAPVSGFERTALALSEPTRSNLPTAEALSIPEAPLVEGLVLEPPGPEARGPQPPRRAAVFQDISPEAGFDLAPPAPPAPPRAAPAPAPLAAITPDAPAGLAPIILD